jgi:thiol peroxidase
MAAGKENTAVLCISKDLPFAHSNFCEAEGIKGVISASEYKTNSFEDAYKVTIKEGPFTGLFSRSVVVISEDGKVVYTEQVPDTSSEPDYEKALAALS